MLRVWGLGLSVGFRQVGDPECRGKKAQWWQVLAFEWLQSFGFRECDVAIQSKVIELPGFAPGKHFDGRMQGWTDPEL